MKLFDFLQDCVAIGAVLFLVSAMTGDDSGTGLDGAAGREASSPGLAAGQLSGSAVQTLGPVGESMGLDLDALERELDDLLADNPASLDAAAADPFGKRLSDGSTAARPTLRAPVTPRQPDVVREVLPMPDASDYDLQGDRLLPTVMPWQRQPVAAQPRGSQHRAAGSAPSASGPISTPRTQPPSDRFDLEAFGASVGRDLLDGLANAPAAPKRVR